MVTTNDHGLWSFMWSYKDHGKSWPSVYGRAHPPGFRWLHDSFGSNYRMLEVQAAIGRIQLGRMQEWSYTRRRNAMRIWAGACRCPGLRVPAVPEWAEHAAYKCYVFVEPERLSPGWDRDCIMAEINARGVPCHTGSCSEVYLEKAFDRTGWRPATRLSVAKELGETCLMFLVHPTLEAMHIDKTCQALDAVMHMAAGAQEAIAG